MTHGDEHLLAGGGRNRVHRTGDVVLRPSTPTTPSVLALLRHLESVGFAGAPRVVGSGLHADGREVLTYIDGSFTHPGPWSLEGVARLGAMLRELHEATASFVEPLNARWIENDVRLLGDHRRVISHCDLGPWNIVTRGGLPVGFIDWEFAGPVNPIVELAEVCWLNAKLHDDQVAELEGLPTLRVRAEQMRALVDAYGLGPVDRLRLVDLMIELIIVEVAWEADEAGVTPKTTEHPVGLWAMAWRARAGRWILRNRQVLEDALR